MEVTCGMCGHKFVPNAKDKEFILQAAEKGMRLAVITCPKCPMGKVDPVAITSDLESANANVDTPQLDNETPYRCPVSGCYGLVSFIDNPGEKSFWGCGECGCIWYNTQNFFNEISEIVKKYPYRQHSYKKTGNEWLPCPLEKEAKNYDTLVEKEPSGLTKNYIRG